MQRQVTLFDFLEPRDLVIQQGFRVRDAHLHDASIIEQTTQKSEILLRVMRTATGSIRAVIVSVIGVAAAVAADAVVVATGHAETMQTREEHLNEKLYGSVGLERAFERDEKKLLASRVSHHSIGTLKDHVDEKDAPVFLLIEVLDGVRHEREKERETLETLAAHACVFNMMIMMI